MPAAMFNWVAISSTLAARGAVADTPTACSVDLGRTIYDAQAHPGVGGAGTAACSGDLLLGALAACAQLTCQMVATAMGLAPCGLGAGNSALLAEAIGTCYVAESSVGEFILGSAPG